MPDGLGQLEQSVGRNEHEAVAVVGDDTDALIALLDIADNTPGRAKRTGVAWYPD